jgi:hypothetical protein
MIDKMNWVEEKNETLPLINDGFQYHTKCIYTSEEFICDFCHSGEEFNNNKTECIKKYSNSSTNYTCISCSDEEYISIEGSYHVQDVQMEQNQIMIRVNV